MWRGNALSFRVGVVGLATALACASACSGDDDGDSDNGGTSGSAGTAGGGTSGTAGTAGAANGGAAGTSTGGNGGKAAAGMGGANRAGAGMGGQNGGDAGSAGAGAGGKSMGGAGMGGATAGMSGAGRGGAGMGGAGMGGAGRGGAGMGGAGRGGAGMGGAGRGGAGMGGAGMGGAGGAGIGGMAGAGGVAGAGMAGAGTGGMSGNAGAGGGGGVGGGTPAPINLFFSEYYEGTSATQTSAVEIYNAGTEAVSLIACTLRVYPNSVGTFNTILLSTTLLPNQVYVVCSTAIGANCDLINSTMAQVTGNDAVALVCNGTEIQDIIGQTSLAPASGEWGTGNTSTADNTIRRMCSVTMGDRQGIDAFNPAFQWLGFPANTSSDLGMRFCP